MPGLGWSLLYPLAATQLFAFAWAVAVRPDLIDRIDGYRIHGVVPSVLYGALWVAFGTCQLAWRRGASDAHAPLLAQP